MFISSRMDMTAPTAMLTKARMRVLPEDFLPSDSEVVVGGAEGVSGAFDGVVMAFADAVEAGKISAPDDGAAGAKVEVEHVVFVELEGL